MNRELASLETTELQFLHLIFTAAALIVIVLKNI